MHISVLLHEILDHANLTPGAVYFDGTLGGGGHAKAIYEKYAPITVIGCDADETAVARAEAILRDAGCEPTLFVSNFRQASSIFAERSLSRPDLILLDLGLSSFQFDTDKRGFSFRQDEPLQMTLTAQAGDAMTAYDVVNGWEEENLITIFQNYGEERFAKRIAAAIVAARAKAPITTTTMLAEIAKNAVPVFARFGRIHPATKIFQAIRIAVNDELGALREGIASLFELLAPNGQLMIISFHSLEDRIVKNYFNTFKEEGRGQVITKKPIVPTDSETEANPRSRSAKLRIIKKL